MRNCVLSEAFCLYAEREVFKPYEKHHSTALDAGRLATQLQVKNLLLYHTEDKTLATRRQNYTEKKQLRFLEEKFMFRMIWRKLYYKRYGMK